MSIVFKHKTVSRKGLTSLQVLVLGIKSQLLIRVHFKVEPLPHLTVDGVTFANTCLAHVHTRIYLLCVYTLFCFMKEYSRYC